MSQVNAEEVRVVRAAVSSERHEALGASLKKACSRVPPLWPLKNFVAVNPFLGLADQPFGEACATMRRVAHADILMPLDFYRGHVASGRIGSADLQRAIDLGTPVLASLLGPSAEPMTVARLEGVLAQPGPPDAVAPEGAVILSVADALDRAHDGRWGRLVVDEISKWCAAYWDEGQSAWRMPWRQLAPFPAWKQAMSLDRTPEINGVRQFRERVATLPDDPVIAIEFMLQALQVPQETTEPFLHRQFMTIAGWSAYVQYRVREQALHGKTDDSLSHLLAIRLAWDWALYCAHDAHDANGHGVSRQAWRAALGALGAPPAPQAPQVHDAAAFGLALRYLLQQAFELAFQRELVARLAEANAGPTAPGRAAMPRKAVQALFCIDVRSEVYRRSLEAVSPDVETIGFAGFFAMFIEYIPIGHQHGSAQCPVLFKPKFRVRETVKKASAADVDEILSRRVRYKLVSKAWRSFKTSAVSCFPFVETAGLLFGAKLVTDTFGITRTVVEPKVDGLDARVARRVAPQIEREVSSLGSGTSATETGIAGSAQLDAAATALGAMALTSNFARLVMVCGHGSTTVNNPYASGLDCGACGGHTGEANARVGAAILNHPDVRTGLAQRGIHIPEDTWFLAALHDTCTDDIRLFDEEMVPASHAHDLSRLRVWLDGASRRTREQRAAALGIDADEQEALDAQVRARSRDWAQVRSEWALANNAAFIAAPRERTRNVNLGGRAFLHNYHHEADPQKAVLELIMTAPMVVANWINMQYYASTVNNAAFGSGNKVLHNVVGTLGVLQGNGGDLQVGLPMQSVHDGKRFMHEPLRLNVFIEAPQEDIDRIIARHANVRDLLDNGWLHLFRIADEGRRYLRYAGKLRWEAVN
jgi:hypothetical protein